jgi:hypothetical protein
MLWSDALDCRRPFIAQTVNKPATATMNVNLSMVFISVFLSLVVLRPPAETVARTGAAVFGTATRAVLKSLFGLGGFGRARPVEVQQELRGCRYCLFRLHASYLTHLAL